MFSVLSVNVHIFLLFNVLEWLWICYCHPLWAYTSNVSMLYPGPGGRVVSCPCASSTHGQTDGQIIECSWAVALHNSRNIFYTEWCWIKLMLVLFCYSVNLRFVCQNTQLIEWDENCSESCLLFISPDCGLLKSRMFRLIAVLVTVLSTTVTGRFPFVFTWSHCVCHCNQLVIGYQFTVCCVCTFLCVTEHLKCRVLLWP